jgi:hypothetical protein
MKARVTIEYDLPFDNPVVLREREEERWTASATLLSLPESMVVVKVEILEKPFMPAGSARRLRSPAVARAGEASGPA